MNQPPKTIHKNNYQIFYFTHCEHHLFFQYNYNHPVSTQLNFTLGNITVFINDQVFRLKLMSGSNLNKKIQWDKGFFTTLLERFEEFAIEKTEDENDSSLKIKVYDKGETLLMGQLVEEFGHEATKQFWKEFTKYNEYEQQEIKKFQQKNNHLRREKQETLEDLKRFQSECEEEKAVLLGRLSAIYREKVSKLREFGEDYVMQEPKEEKSQSQQDSRVMSTLQEEKQYMGSLFQQSQYFYK